MGNDSVLHLKDPTPPGGPSFTISVHPTDASLLELTVVHERGRASFTVPRSIVAQQVVAVFGAGETKLRFEPAEEAGVCRMLLAGSDIEWGIQLPIDELIRLLEHVTCEEEPVNREEGA